MYNLTLRQAQGLISIAYRKNVLGIVKLGDLITDMGVAFATLANHLEALQKHRYIRTPKDTRPHNLSFSDEITITAGGEVVAQRFMESINALYSNSTPATLFEKLREAYKPKTPKGYQIDLFFQKTRTATFAKAFEKLVVQNPTEPVLTSIAMYADFDSQLSLMKSKNNKKYKLLSTAKLNLEIRNGRLASIAIPTAIRGTTSLTELGRILANSWSWLGTVDLRSTKRYWQEAMSLGLLQVNGDLTTSMKPTAVDTISWLASKTYFTFINTIPIAPKCSLVLFRESFKFPTEEDLMNPQNASVELPWLRSIWDNMANRSDYIDTIKEGLRIVRDDANLLQTYEGRIIPTTVIRKINSIPDLRIRFRTIMKRSDTIIAKILIAITSKPAISIYELYSDLAEKAKHKLSMDDVWQTVSILATNNLVHLANSRSVLKDSTRLFSFIHIPFLASETINRDETNAVLRSIKPYLLQLIKELFVTLEEREAVYNVFNDLMKTEHIDLDSVEKEYGKTIRAKLLVLGRSIEPFVTIDTDYRGLNLNRHNIALNKILIDSLLYSTLTQNEGLEVYSQTISTLVEKDKPWVAEVEDEVKSLTSALIQQTIN